MAENTEELKGIAKVNAERKAAKKAAEKPEPPKAPESPETPEVPQAPEPPKAPEAPQAPAGDPQADAPSPEFRGNTAGDITDKPTDAPESEADPADENDPCVKLAKQYAKLYPKNKTFYITSDMQVFLADGQRMAHFHQRGKQGQVTTVNID